MKITILVDDKAVYVDGRAMRITDLDWSKFFGDPSSKEDDIHAVQFNTERGQGHVEYKNYPTKQLGRPDVPTPDWCIDTAIFEREFAWVLPHYEAALSQAVAAEAAERAAEDEANAERIERGEAPAVQAAAYERRFRPGSGWNRHVRFSGLDREADKEKRLVVQRRGCHRSRRERRTRKLVCRDRRRVGRRRSADRC